MAQGKDIFFACLIQDNSAVSVVNGTIPCSLHCLTATGEGWHKLPVFR